MNKQPTKMFGQADLIDKSLGLDVFGEKIASIILFAANIEHYLERAIWILDEVDPKGVRPKTDAKSITDLIGMLERHAPTVSDDNVRLMLETWCKSARSGFIIRHNIAHGVSYKMEKMLVFSRNPRWHGEVRKREYGDLWCEPYILDMIRESLATLLRIIASIAKDDQSLEDIAEPLALKALNESRSMLSEFADQFYT